MKLTADEQILKEALLSEIDRYRYRFYEGSYLNRRGMPSRLSEDQANRERLAFVDHVIARVRQMKAPEPETMDVPGIGRLVTAKGLREIAARYKLSEAEREEIRNRWADVSPSLVEMLLEPGVKVSAIGVDARPRGHFLSVEEQRELRDNPTPMVIDDLEGMDAQAAHLKAALLWTEIAEMLLTEDINNLNQADRQSVMDAELATGRANEASKAAPPNAAAFAACAAALTACALRDAPAAVEAHRRAAAAYSVTKEGL